MLLVIGIIFLGSCPFIIRFPPTSLFCIAKALSTIAIVKTSNSIKKGEEVTIVHGATANQMLLIRSLTSSLFLSGIFCKKLQQHKKNTA